MCRSGCHPGPAAGRRSGSGAWRRSTRSAWPGTHTPGREPQLMLLDEPFGALDALTRTRMHTLLQDLCARHQPAVLLVTHDVDEAVLLADRALVLVDGTITIDVPIELDRPRDRGHP